MRRRRTHAEVLERMFQIIAKGRAVQVRSAEGRGVSKESRQAAADALRNLHSNSRISTLDREKLHE